MSTRTVAVLLEIMGDRRVPISRRIQAAETLISFETTEEIAARTKAFLTAVVESEHVALNLRLDASKLMRKAESPKVTPQTVRTTNPGRWREVWREVAIGRRRLRLDKAGLWPPPRDWCDDLLDPDYEPPLPSEVPR
jgi:hypothetical protein